ncbi:unnamed protein product [Rotaria sp. Silwood1]|nr:unnamed protein product [Rotaria sp. Silwood1]CAF1005454.1 unnamed protein product [Rotaria sp. Silwood1]CAF1014218.1 unnamed protein product [Rotaria sp. Silwood1]
MDVLYSLFGIDNQRLDAIIQSKAFIKTLNFVLTTTSNDVLPIADSIVNRYCIDILPKINYNVRSLILESESMERILLAAGFPNLTELKLYNVDDYIVSHYFTGKQFPYSSKEKDFIENSINIAQYLIVLYLVESPFRRIFQPQITDLILVYKNDINILLMNKNAKFVYEYTFKLFENLKHLSVIGLPPIFSVNYISLATCFSSNLYKLCLHINTFEDCFALLDGRLKHLSMLIVNINSTEYHPSVVYNIDMLPNMKYFSLTCRCSNDEYDTHVVPLLRRMFNLEELNLNIINEKRSSFVDGTQINEKILIHMPPLSKFTFYISTKTKRKHMVHHLSNHDIEQTFFNIGYEQVCCFLTRITTSAICNIFSLPFVFDYLEYVGNTLPSMTFSRVTKLMVHDILPFSHEFFIGIARFFPLLKTMRVLNIHPQLQMSHKLNSNDNQLHSIVEYPFLISLSLFYTHIDYVEQFLNKTKTHLPRFTELTVDYDQLRIVTENFTRDTTRLNCVNVKKLIFEKSIVHSKDFYTYFPLL